MNIKKQTVLMYLYEAALAFRMADAVWVIFLLERGFTLAQVGIAEGIYHITSMTFEVPSGMAADLFGRKRTLIMSGVVGVCSAIFMTLEGWTGFVYCGMVFSALSLNLASGTEEALVYDSLLEVGQEDRYKKVWANSSMIGRTASAVSCVASPVAILIGYKFTYYIGALLYLCTILFLLPVREPTVAERQEQLYGMAEERQKRQYGVTEGSRKQKRQYGMTEGSRKQKRRHELTEERQKRQYGATEGSRKQKRQYDVTERSRKQKRQYELTERSRKQKRQHELTEERRRRQYNVTEKKQEAKRREKASRKSKAGSAYRKRVIRERWRQHICGTAAFIRENPKTMLKLFADAALACPCYLIMMFLQEHLVNCGWPKSFIGIPMFVIPLAGAVGTRIAGKNRSGLRRSLLFCGVISGIGTCLVGSEMLAVILIGACIQRMCEGFSEITVSGNVNRDFSSDYRATLVSVGSMCYSLLMVAASPAAGFVGEHYSVNTVFYLLGGGLLAATAAAYLMVGQKRKA